MCSISVAASYAPPPSALTRLLFVLNTVYQQKWACPYSWLDFLLAFLDVF